MIRRRIFRASFQEKYFELVQRNEIFTDELQISVVQKLQKKIPQYEKYHMSWLNLRSRVKYVLAAPVSVQKSSEYEEFSLPKKFPLIQSTYTLLSSPFLSCSTQGFYMWGKSGCGKTFISELFFDSLAVPAESKKKMHYNEFMLSVHKRSFFFHEQKLQDSLFQFAKEFSSATSMLYLDEFQVTDIADALILQRLFTLLWSFGVLLFTTSNRAPETLYHNGVQRANFLPFIPLLKAHCEVIKMEFKRDYREAMVLAELTQKSDEEGNLPFYSLVAEDAGQKLFSLFSKYSGGRAPQPMEIAVLPGRKVGFQGHKDVLWTTFADLILRELGPDDYIALAQHFAVAFVLNVPQISSSDDNVCRRFIWFIDQVYRHKTKLFIAAERPLHELFAYTAGDTRDVALEITRCLSRINEIQTRKYFNAPHRGA